MVGRLEDFLAKTERAIEKKELTTKEGLDFAMAGAIVTALADITNALKDIREELQRIATRIV